MRKKYLIGVLALILATLMFVAACGRNNDDEPAAGDFIERHLRLPLPLPHTITFNGHVLGNEHEMLALITGNLYHRVVCPEAQWPIYVPEFADGYPQQMDDDGLVWRISIRQGFTFSDGVTPINAHTFEFSQRALVSPILLNRNQNSPGLLDLPEYFRGEIPWEQVRGFRVIDDYTIELTYRPEMRPELGAYHVMQRLSGSGGLVHPETFEANWNDDRTINTWGLTPFLPHFMGAGAFLPTGYLTDQSIEFTRRTVAENPVADWFTADRITWTIAPDEATQIMLFESGELDQARANATRFDEHPELFHYANGFVYGIFLNPFSETNPILQDVNFRRALYWALDRDRIVGAAFPASRPQAFLWPETTRIRANDFLETGNRLMWRETHWAQQVNINGRPLTRNGFDTEAALHYFNLAWEANGSVPVNIEVLYSDAGAPQQMWAEAVQEAWQTTFGADRITVTLRSMPTIVILEQHLRRTMMDYEIAADRRFWMALDNEPWWNTNWIGDDHEFSYDTQYAVLDHAAQAEFDRLFNIAHAANRHTPEHRELRNQITADVENLILNDHSFIPTHNHRDRLIISPWLTSIIPNGHYAFRAAPWQFIWDDALHTQERGGN